MANTIREGFAACLSMEGSRITLSKKRACTSLQVARDDSSGLSHKRSRNMEHGAADVVSLLVPSDSFSDPEQPVLLPPWISREDHDQGHAPTYTTG